MQYDHIVENITFRFDVTFDPVQRECSTCPPSADVHYEGVHIIIGKEDIPIFGHTGWQIWDALKDDFMEDLLEYAKKQAEEYNLPIRRL